MKANDRTIIELVFPNSQRPGVRSEARRESLVRGISPEEQRASNYPQAKTYYHHCEDYLFMTIMGVGGELWVGGRCRYVSLIINLRGRLQAVWEFSKYRPASLPIRSAERPGLRRSANYRRLIATCQRTTVRFHIIP